MVLALVAYCSACGVGIMQVAANQDRIFRGRRKIYRRVEPRIGESYVLLRTMYTMYVFNVRTVRMYRKCVLFFRWS